MKTTIEDNNVKVIIECEEQHISEVIELVKYALLGLGFSEELINDYIIESGGISEFIQR